MSEDEGTQGAGTRPTAFLSYSHADQDRVRVLASALEQAGISVWWDTLIEGGASSPSRSRSPSHAATPSIVAWSKVSVSSDWVLDEASQGRDLRKLVPVSLDGTMPPLGFRQYLVGRPARLARRCQRSADRDRSCVASKQSWVAADAAAPSRRLHAPGSPPPARLTRRTMLLAAGGTALAGAVGSSPGAAVASAASRPRRRATASRCCLSRTSAVTPAGLFLRRSVGGTALDPGAQPEAAGHGADVVRQVPRPHRGCRRPSPRSSASPTCSMARCGSRATSRASPPT